MILATCIFTTVLTVFYAVVVLFFRRGWLRIANWHTTGKTPATPVSILIAARNEEENIAATINDILAQDYPSHLIELIIVDDHSTDKTAEICESYAASGVRLIRLNELKALNSYKKKAITEAINQATGELLITTDADCRMKTRWISTIVSCYETTGSKLISSPVVYFGEKNGFEKLQTLEFLYLIGLGASMIGNGRPSTCNGANLAYRKDVFIELEGFKGIDDLASGDDELFLHKVASRYPSGISFCKSADALVYTHAKPNLKEFIRQRKRWASKSVKYKDKKIVALGISVWLYNVCLLLLALAGFFQPMYWQLMLYSLLPKIIVELIFLIPVTRFTGRMNLLRFLPVLTVVHIVYLVYIGLSGNSGKYVWKERTVR